MEVLLVGVFTSAGALAGAGGRVLLGRLHRGTRVTPGWCEGATGLLWTVLGLRVAGGGGPPWWWLPVPLALAWLAVLLTVVDLRHRRLPDALTLPAYPVLAVLIAVAAAGGAGWPLVARAVAGALLFWGVHAMVRRLVPGSLGAGDVKLAGVLGAVLGVLGWAALALAAVGAAVVTLVLLLAAPARVSRRWRTGVPHGPGLLAATWLIAAFPGAALLSEGWL
ncbi:leader peptidase (prepilin peptidase)/N-methyltransferase [Herbihabitans rhizosphaerae]|uniref:Leader peptidase (Prepilin peptidase)/N-methyltransferase n=1 Tax=Herbihabitans rhizosphaerae TaxID=1872711 RepID=A0A4V2EU33_9PSEU|nr:A24 family peptidase [Herbihabitans rhizosphaerae]RZS43173.1 leader peptidase (prepilin peptidase)/N-methyltransferase [Herbihabitans rhizosphaerae]